MTKNNQDISGYLYETSRLNDSKGTFESTNQDRIYKPEFH